MREPQTTQLLHVEDDDICLMMLNRAFKKAKIANPISVAHDGIEALEQAISLSRIRRMHSWKQRRCWILTGGWSNFRLRDLRAHLMNGFQR
jgi:hypothetical protein